eukprot:CAMPEP_0172390946 /NCGR_PEP_ID=MMETSP1061-20121228/7492_1 /TAXON_ID=37318 /ORGANISM="Pseudo-nitzschia pungens, Strain cf. pungens" /LENGTH=185 /DNA_ID=CAMNT_0013121463 /DNA_START=134 /DNA_END=691 /DNA_ORIENTATION=-
MLDNNETVGSSSTNFHLSKRKFFRIKRTRLQRPGARTPRKNASDEDSPMAEIGDLDRTFSFDEGAEDDNHDKNCNDNNHYNNHYNNHDNNHDNDNDNDGKNDGKNNDNKTSNNSPRFFIRSTRIPKRKLIIERTDDDDQHFSSFRNKRKKVKIHQGNHMNSYKRLYLDATGNAFKPDYNLTISWL